jgi:hypothetical protein
VKMIYVLAGAIVAAAAIGGAKSMASSGAPAPEPTPIAAVPADENPAPAQDANGASVIEGEVLEAIEVPNYSYLRLGAKGTEGRWVAVPTARLAVGAHARVSDAMEMQNFKSTALGRTFPVIYFGTLGGGAPVHGVVDPRASGADPHANGADPHGGAASPHGASPHGQQAAAPAEVKAVPRAKGANGKTVAEVIGQRTDLRGKTVRIRGTVVKVTAGVLGKTYLHLRDGSGDASAGTNDITVTTQAVPAVNDTIVIEGVVAIDRDIGSGYKFPTLVEEAKVVTE